MRFKHKRCCAAALLWQIAAAQNSLNSWCSTETVQSCPTNGQVLADLSCGWCRSWTFGTNIAANTLRLVGLDGGPLPGDGQADHVYMVSASLNDAFELADGTAWKLSTMPSSVYNLRDSALWSTEDNSTLYMYGGHSPSDNIPNNNLIAKFNSGTNSWSMQNSVLQSQRLTDGASVNVPELGAAFYIGGQENKQTTSDDSVQDGKLHYATSVLRFDLATGNPSAIDAPFLPTQFGAAAYIPTPAGNSTPGTLIYFGGETPSQNVVTNDNNLTVSKWDHVWIYDIAGDQWYKQPTTGSAPARSEFCSVSLYDDATNSWQLWVMGGADYNTGEIVSGVSILSIPSFHWFTAGSVPQSTPPRMSLACENYGSQIFGIGGRTEKTATGGQDYPAIAYIYDANEEDTASSFDPSKTAYTAPQSVRKALATSSLPASWADPTLAALFVAPTTSSAGSADPTSSGGPPGSDAHESSLSGGAIAGIVVGAIAVLAIIVGTVFLVLKRTRSSPAPKELAAGGFIYEKVDASGNHNGNSRSTAEIYEHYKPQLLPESDTRTELETGVERWEVEGSNTFARAPRRHAPAM